MNTPDLDETAFCPRGPICEVCGAVAGLSVVTPAAGRLGVLCLTLCPTCVPPRMTPTVAMLRVGEHAAHLGIDLDQMAELLGRGDR